MSANVVCISHRGQSIAELTIDENNRLVRGLRDRRGRRLASPTQRQIPGTVPLAVALLVYRQVVSQDTLYGQVQYNEPVYSCETHANLTREQYDEAIERTPTLRDKEWTRSLRPAATYHYEVSSADEMLRIAV